MIFIADSGSTKCDGVFIDEKGTEIARVHFKGVNPYFHSAEYISQQLLSVPEITEYGNDTREVFFYGAGCSFPALHDKVKQGLLPHFPDSILHIDHDLAACAHATYQGNPAVSCILGTGSNCVYFDGKNLKETISGLGYILGDEGSAAHIGKEVIKAFFYKLMPAEAHEEFGNTYGYTKDMMYEKVYQNPGANVFLGSLAKFAKKHEAHPFFRKLVFDSFDAFITTQVMSFKEAKDVAVHFVGSTAHHFSDILREAIEKNNLKMGRILQRPLDGLVQYHIKARQGLS